MNLITFALRKPITLMMAIVALVGAGVLPIRQMRVDIFPALNEPQKGSEMTSPLGRAVIGGLVVSTFVTLLIVPAVFVLLMDRVRNASPSMDPNDPQSGHYDGSPPPEPVAV